ncbi:MFS transporter [Chloroflexota bacterium]
MSLYEIRRKVFYGWWIVLACSLISSFGAGTFHYGFSVFVRPVSIDLGWSLVLVSGAFSLYRLEAGILAPLAGFLLDRYGPRKLVMAGAILMGAGFIFLSQAKTVVPFYSAFVIISAGFTFTSGTAIGAPLIGKWFVKKRSRALGIYAAIFGLGGLLVPVLSQMIILYGWRTTLLVMGPCIWLVDLSLALMLRHKPEEHGLLPDGDTPHTRNNDGSPKAADYIEVDFSVRKAVSTRSFWILSLCLTAFQMTMAAIYVHLINHMVTVGIEISLAATAVTLLAVTSILGRLGFGWLGDFFSKKRLLIIIFLLQGLGIFALAQVQQMWHIVPFLLAYAPGYGGLLALKPAIVGEYYGRKNFGTIYGVIQGISTAGGIAGPVFAGWVYDTNGNYFLAFIIFAFINIAAAFLLLFLRRPGLPTSELGERHPSIWESAS